MAGALHETYDQCIIHQDIEPGNIFFVENGLAYLADFGIAKVLMRPP
jgi:serine/threonine protein kinase